MIMARSCFSLWSCPASFKYMNTVKKGAWPLVVIRVMTWYWMVWMPFFTSSRRRFSTIASICSLVPSHPSSFISSRTSSTIFWRLTSTKGAK